MSKSKCYCYVDETGQDTVGRFFLVSIILTSQTKKDYLETVIEEIESRTGKKKTKWTKARTDIKIRFLENISNVKDLQSSVYYSQYNDCTTGYEPLTSLSIAKVIQAKGEDNCSVTIVVDALTRKGIEKMRHELKRLHVKYDNIVGLKDEQSAFLRLADCFAGFIRDYIEGQNYTKKLFLALEKRGIVTEV
jgi:Protein of unknown function (DUF3800)